MNQDRRKKREEFIQNRLAKSWDVYDKFFFQTNHGHTYAGKASQLEVSQTDFLAKLSTILPLSNRASIERRGLLENTSVGDMGTWEPASNGRLVLHLEGDAGSATSHLNTSIPLLGIPQFAAIAIFVLLVSLFLFVNYIIRKVVRARCSKACQPFVEKAFE